MRIQHNIAAMNSYRNFQTQNSGLSKNLEKLSSGYKINRAGDDAAGLAISEKMRAQITGLAGAQKNAKDGISLVQTAEGALQEVHDMLNRMYSLAEQSANGTYSSDTDRPQLQKEVDALREEINRIADSSNFNGTKLLDGDLNAGTFKVPSGGGDANSAKVVLLGTTVTDKKDTEAVRQALAKAQIDEKSVSVKIDSASASKVSASFTDLTETTIKIFGTDAKVAIDFNDDQVQDKKFGDDGLTTDTFKGKIKVGLGTQSATTVATFEFKLSRGASGTSDIYLGAGKALELQIGDTGDSYNKMKVNVGDVHSYALNIDNDKVDISTQTGAASAMDIIKKAIDKVSDVRGGLGALQNRLDHTINNLGVMQENIQNAESTIRDTDVADEMMAYTKNSILNQAAQAMLAQANQLPQGVLQLLQ